jgi:hypothetical protein
LNVSGATLVAWHMMRGKRRESNCHAKAQAGVMKSDDVRGCIRRLAVGYESLQIFHASADLLSTLSSYEVAAHKPEEAGLFAYAENNHDTPNYQRVLHVGDDE